MVSGAVLEIPEFNLADHFRKFFFTTVFNRILFYLHVLEFLLFF